MAINASTAPTGGGRPQPVIEVGAYPARLVQVIDCGLQPQGFKGEVKAPKREINLTYELANVFMVDDDGNEDPSKPRWVGERMALNNLKADKAKSTLRASALDPTGQHKGDFIAMLGAACTVTIIHNPARDGSGKVYANVGNVGPAMKGFPVPALVNDPRFFDLDEPDMEVFEQLPQFLQDRIKANLEFPGSKLVRLEFDGTTYVADMTRPAHMQ